MSRRVLHEYAQMWRLSSFRMTFWAGLLIGLIASLMHATIFAKLHPALLPFARGLTFLMAFLGGAAGCRVFGQVVAKMRDVKLPRDFCLHYAAASVAGPVVAIILLGVWGVRFEATVLAHSLWTLLGYSVGSVIMFCSIR